MRLAQRNLRPTSAAAPPAIADPVRKIALSGSSGQAQFPDKMLDVRKRHPAPPPQSKDYSRSRASVRCELPPKASLCSNPALHRVASAPALHRGSCPENRLVRFARTGSKPPRWGIALRVAALCIGLRDTILGDRVAGGHTWELACWGHAAGEARSWRNPRMATSPSRRLRRRRLRRGET